MYKKILIPLENSSADQAVLDHIRPLAKLTGAALVLVHVADGWAARNFQRLHLAESEEMKADKLYLKMQSDSLINEGFSVEYFLATGEPSQEIIKLSKAYHVDLIAMSTHGHGIIADFIYGSTADKVRHSVVVPVLMVRS
ncbi:MAG: universal stress protein [Candidatus Margulisbacteria bacterium]|nr:universal stress protein [Candidatus Margulisiibacteriota bacterium]